MFCPNIPFSLTVCSHIYKEKRNIIVSLIKCEKVNISIFCQNIGTTFLPMENDLFLVNLLEIKATFTISVSTALYIQYLSTQYNSSHHHIDVCGKGNPWSNLSLTAN